MGEYEDPIANNSGWATGDWNGDTELNSGDLVAAFRDGGFEAGRLPATAAVVPEPSSFLLAMMAACALCDRRTRRGKRGGDAHHSGP